MDSFIVMSTDHVQKVHLCVGDRISLAVSAYYKDIPQRDSPTRQRIELIYFFFSPLFFMKLLRLYRACM